MADIHQITSGQIDYHDLTYVMERLGRPVSMQAAPTSIYASGEHKGKVKINPHVSRFFWGDGSITDVFHVKPIYYLHIDGSWRPMSEIASYHGNKRIDLKENWDERLDLSYLAWMLKRAELLKGKVTIPSPSWLQPRVPLSMTPKSGHATINFSTLTAYPDPHPETTTVDGKLWGYHAGGGVSFASVRDAATCDSGLADDSGTADMLWRSDHFTNNGFSFDRPVWLFDTSGLTSGANISATVLSIYRQTGGQDGSNDAYGYLAINTTSPASNTALVSDDFDQTGGTTPTEQHDSGERKDITTVIAGAAGYLDFTLNATGRGNVSKTAVTKFGGREGHDMTNNAIGTGNGTNGSYILWSSAETSGTTEDPKLVVTYTTNTNYDETYTEAIGANDTVIKASTRTLSDVIGANDSILKSISRTISDLIGAADSILTEKVIPVVLTELVALNDTIVRSIGAVRTEAMALNDTFLSAWTAAREFTESIGLNDTFTRVWTRIVVLTENIGLNDVLQKLFNGSAVLWSRVARNVATWRRIDRDNP